MTDAEVTYDRLGSPVTESFPTVLINRARTTWIDLQSTVLVDESAADDGEPGRVRYVKDFTNSVAE